MMATATSTKTLFENKQLRNRNYFAIVSSYSPCEIPTNYAKTWRVETPLKV